MKEHQARARKLYHAIKSHDTRRVKAMRLKIKGEKKKLRAQNQAQKQQLKEQKQEIKSLDGKILSLTEHLANQLVAPE